MERQRTYQFKTSRLTLCFGDITKSDAQVIVSSDDHYLTMGEGVSAAILQAGGNAIALDAAKKAPAEVGDVVVTNAGTLPAQYVFHAVTIRQGQTAADPRAIIRKSTERCLALLDSLNLHTIAFPAIGAGVAGFSYEDIAVEMADVIATDLVRRERPVEATIYLFDSSQDMQAMDVVRFFEEFAIRVPHLPSPNEKPPAAFSAVCADWEANREGTVEDVKSKRINHLRRLLAALEDQRFKLEQQLIAALGEKGPGDSSEGIWESLRRNEQLRLGYQGELRTLTETSEESASPVEHRAVRTVFVSSTFRDLEEHRAAIKDQIGRRELLFRGMEHFGADPSAQTPANKIVEEVRKADLYIGVFGVRYGSIDPATGVSMTELEFNEAESSGKPMLLYVIKDDAPVRVADIEPNAQSKTRLDALKAKILSTHVAYKFMSVEDLARQVFEDLGKPLYVPQTVKGTQ